MLEVSMVDIESSAAGRFNTPNKTFKSGKTVRILEIVEFIKIYKLLIVAKVGKK
jgi:hypothetical protein